MNTILRAPEILPRPRFRVLTWTRLLGVTMLLCGTLRGEEWRTFIDRDGRELVARVIELTDDEVVIERKSDQKTFTLPQENFSDADQEYFDQFETGDGSPALDEAEGPAAFESVDSEVSDYFPDIAKGKGKAPTTQHFPLGPIGGVISVDMGTDEAKVLSLAPQGPGAKAGLEVGDRITGAGGRGFNPVSADPATGGDGLPRQLGEAILAAQAADGALKLSIGRDGEEIDLVAELGTLADFSKSFPSDCKRSSILLDASCDWLARNYAKHGNFGSGDAYSNAYAALALLASGNPEYGNVIRNHARKVAAELEGQVDDNNWRSSARGIFLAEYGIATGDAGINDALEKCCEQLAKRVDPETGRLGHGGTDLPYGGKGLVITSAHFHHLWALAAHAGVPLDETAWDLSYGSVEASIGAEGNVGYNFSLTVSAESMARTGLMATALELSDKSSSDRRGMYRWLGDNIPRATNGHTVTSMGLIFGVMGTKNAGNSEHRDFLDYHRWLLALTTPMDPQQGAWYYGARGNIGGDGYLGYRTVGNYVTALILASERDDTLWTFGNRTANWYKPG